MLLQVRDGLTPRSALFLRDAAADFQDINVLNSAKIDITTVISEVTNPQVEHFSAPKI